MLVLLYRALWLRWLMCFLALITPHSLYQTLPLLLFAYVILFIPQAVGSQRSSMYYRCRAVWKKQDAALGKRPSSVFRRITLPLVKPGMLAGGALVFLTCMKELPATLILSPIGFTTLSSQVWSNISEAFFAQSGGPNLAPHFIIFNPSRLDDASRERIMVNCE